MLFLLIRTCVSLLSAVFRFENYLKFTLPYNSISNEIPHGMWFNNSAKIVVPVSFLLIKACVSLLSAVFSRFVKYLIYTLPYHSKWVSSWHVVQYSLSWLKLYIYDRFIGPGVIKHRIYGSRFGFISITVSYNMFQSDIYFFLYSTMTIIFSGR